MRKIPMRTCVATKEKLPKKELIRIVNTKEGIIIDDTGKVNGHGCYLKKDREAIELAEKRKILERVLETEIPLNIYEELKNKVK